MPFGFGVLSFIKKITIPIVSSVNKSVVDFSGGSSVIITGSGFAGASSVKFSSTNAASFNVDSDTQITAVTPSLTASSTPVSVSVGSGSLASAIEFFAPSNIASCFMWMRADLGYTAADSNTWVDQIHGKVFDTSNGYFVSSGNWPTQTTGFGGKTALSFTGNKQIGNATPLGSNGKQEFMIGKSDANPAQNCFRDFGDNTVGIDPFFTLSGEDIYDVWNNGIRNGIPPSTGTGASLASGFLWETTNDGINASYYLNDAPALVGASSSGFASSGTPTYGSSRDGVRTAGSISEDIVFSSVISSSERQRLFAYFKDRYGIPRLPSSFSGLRVWLKADDGANATGGNMTSWSDRSGIGNNLTLVSSTPPTLVPNVLNGLPVVRGNAAASSKIQGSPLNINSTASEAHVFIVAKEGAHIAISGIVQLSGGANLTSLSNDFTAGQIRLDATGGLTLTGIAASNTSFHVLEFVLRSGNTQEVFVDGVSVASGTTSGVLVDASTNLTLFGDGGGQNFSNEDIAEVLIFNVDKTNDRREIELYLRNKWGLL